MIKYTKRDGQQKADKKTKLTHYLSRNGWLPYNEGDSDSMIEIHYLGECRCHGDLFAVYYKNGAITPFKGVRGSEFD